MRHRRALAMAIIRPRAIEDSAIVVVQ